MVVDDLDVPSLIIAPDKTDALLVVDTNAELTLPVAAQRFQPIARRYSQIVEQRGRINRQQLGTSPPLDLLWEVADGVADENRRCAFVGKALDHGDW